METLDAWISLSMSYPPYYYIKVIQETESSAIDYEKTAIQDWIKEFTLHKSLNDIKNLELSIYVTYENPFISSDPTWRVYKTTVDVQTNINMDLWQTVSTAKYNSPVKDDEC